MSDTPIYDQTRAETLLDVDLGDVATGPGDVPALGLLRRPSSARMYVPARLAGPCEDRPPHLLTDDDGIE